MNWLTQIKVLKLIRTANSASPEGHEAAKQLRSIAPKSLPCVLKILLKGEPDDQIIAAKALILLDSKESVEPLIQILLNSPRVEVRVAVADTLGFLRDHRATPHLVSLLNDFEPRVRGQVAFALGSICATEAFGNLLPLLKDDEACVRGNAAFALGQIGDLRAVNPVQELLKDQSSQVRKFAKGALAKFHRIRKSKD